MKEDYEQVSVCYGLILETLLCFHTALSKSFSLSQRPLPSTKSFLFLDLSVSLLPAPCSLNAHKRKPKVLWGCSLKLPSELVCQRTLKRFPIGRSFLHLCDQAFFWETSQMHPPSVEDPRNPIPWRSFSPMGNTR